VGVALRLLGPSATQILVRVLDKPYSRKEMGDFGFAVRAQLRLHRTFGPKSSALRRWVREFHWLLDGLSRRHLHQATPRRRLSPRGGIVIVLLGSDGAGKSTQSKMLIEWLSKKLDVVPIYFGSGDGPSAFYRMPLRWGQRLIGATPADRIRKYSILAKAQIKTHDQREAKTVRSYLHAVARPIWAVALAREKRSKIRQMVRARNRGMAVVCDRFPQSDVVGFNDGPLLAHWQSHPWQICRWLSVWESQPYTNAAKTCPDLVVRLTIDPVAAQQRRPEMSFAGLKRRVAAVKCMKFAKETTVVDIDAEMSIDEVSAAIKGHIWSRL
jgi:thymidylate kinase